MAPEHVEHRLTAILSADVVGYSRRMGTDETGALAQLNAHRKELIDPKTFIWTSPDHRIIEEVIRGKQASYSAH